MGEFPNLRPVYYLRLLVRNEGKTRAAGVQVHADRLYRRDRAGQFYAIGTVLGYVRRLGLLPRLTSDDLRDGLKELKAPPQRIDYRKPAELRSLLAAALRHNAATFAATRDEHAGRAEKGRTARYTPMAPIIAAAIVTGMRFQALIDLDWKHVDLDARPRLPASGRDYAAGRQCDEARGRRRS